MSCWESPGAQFRAVRGGSRLERAAPAGALSISSNVAIGTSTCSSRTTKSSLTRPRTGWPWSVTYAGTRTRFVSLLNDATRVVSVCAVAPRDRNKSPVQTHRMKQKERFLFCRLRHLLVLFSMTNSNCRCPTFTMETPRHGPSVGTTLESVSDIGTIPG
jgi:hypothetical protein